VPISLPFLPRNETHANIDVRLPSSYFQGYLYQAISDMLDVTPGFVSQAKTAYEHFGTAGLTLKHKGSLPFLSAEQCQAVIEWLKSQHDWSVEHLCDYIETTYGVVFQSRQSYYQLLADADIIYKQAQRINPKRDEERAVAKKREHRPLDDTRH
jgi:transposase